MPQLLPSDSFPLRDGEVELRPVRTRDGRALLQLLTDNRAWLNRWEATYPSQQASEPPSLWDVRANIRSLLDQARAGTGLPLLVEFRGELVGQLNVSAIARGSVSSATIGYWISERAAGNNVIPRAVALATDYCFGSLGLHRMEICIRPENAPSLRVVAKLGFRFEGLRRRFIHINGQWADHYCFALLNEEVPAGVLRRMQDGLAPSHLAEVPEAVQAQVGSPLS